MKEKIIVPPQEDVVLFHVDGVDYHPVEFVWKIAHLDSKRWYYEALSAIRCKVCSKVSVAFNGVCGQCGSARVEVLPYSE